MKKSIIKTTHILLEYTKEICIITILLFATPLQVFAATQTTPTYSCTIPLQRLDWDSREDAQINPCTLQKFDVGLGTLTQIDLTLTQSSQGEYGIENTYPEPQTIPVDVSTTVNFYNPDNSLLQQLITTQNSVFDLAAYDTAVDYSGNSGQTNTYNNQSQSQSLTYTGIDRLNQFSNSVPGLIETITFDASGSSDVIITDQSLTDYEDFQALDARATASVVYTYETPEDATFGTEQPAPPNTDLLRSGGENHQLLFMIPLVIISLFGLKLSLFE